MLLLDNVKKILTKVQSLSLAIFRNCSRRNLSCCVAVLGVSGTVTLEGSGTQFVESAKVFLGVSKLYTCRQNINR